MNYQFPWFVIPCIEAFHYLVERYGFKSPKIEQLGRECFVQYQKNNRTVSIAYEPGNIPIVELFHPTEEMKNRTIPKLEKGFNDRRSFKDMQEDAQRQTLTIQARELEEKAQKFLLGEDA